MKAPRPFFAGAEKSHEARGALGEQMPT